MDSFFLGNVPSGNFTILGLNLLLRFCVTSERILTTCMVSCQQLIPSFSDAKQVDPSVYSHSIGFYKVSEGCGQVYKHMVITHFSSCKD